MATTNPKRQAYFSKIFSKAVDSTPQPEREVQHEIEVKVVKPISRVEAAIEMGNTENADIGPSKKSKKRDKSSRRSHSSSRRHCHVVDISSRVLPDNFCCLYTFFIICSN